MPWAGGNCHAASAASTAAFVAAAVTAAVAAVNAAAAQLAARNATGGNVAGVRQGDGCHDALRRQAGAGGVDKNDRAGGDA